MYWHNSGIITLYILCKLYSNNLTSLGKVHKSGITQDVLLCTLCNNLTSLVKVHKSGMALGVKKMLTQAEYLAMCSLYVGFIPPLLYIGHRLSWIRSSLGVFFRFLGMEQGAWVRNNLDISPWPLFIV